MFAKRIFWCKYEHCGIYGTLMEMAEKFSSVKYGIIDARTASWKSYMQQGPFWLSDRSIIPKFVFFARSAFWNTAHYFLHCDEESPYSYTKILLISLSIRILVLRKMYQT